jgi:hypothetical protein
MNEITPPPPIKDPSQIQSIGYQEFGSIVWFGQLEPTVLQRLFPERQRGLSFILVGGLLHLEEPEILDRAVTTIWSGAPVRFQHGISGIKGDLTPEALETGGVKAITGPILIDKQLIHPPIISCPSGDWTDYAWDSLSRGQFPDAVIDGSSSIGLVQKELDRALKAMLEQERRWRSGSPDWANLIGSNINIGSMWVLLSALVAHGVKPTIEEAQWVLRIQKEREDRLQKNESEKMAGYEIMRFTESFGDPSKILVAAAVRAILEKEETDKRTKGPKTTVSPKPRKI